MEDQNQECVSILPDNQETVVPPSWTRFEEQLERFQSDQCDGDPVYDAIKRRMGESSLAFFLEEFNPTQHQDAFIQQDKLERMQFDIGQGLVNVNKLERSNDICEDLLKLIGLCLDNSPSGKMTVKKVLKSMNFLRLTGSKVTAMDDTLRRLRDLRVLVLGGNCLTSCPGSCLPRSLMVLELCYNRLEDVDCLADNPPPHLVYLGLARNNITSEVLEPLRQFQYLCHLDLAQNDIVEMSAVVAASSHLPRLSSLSLSGNPCSMSRNYLVIILKNLPKLVFLDGQMLKRVDDVGKDEDFEQLMQGTLKIHLFRVMGIPQPSNEKINNKKVTHTYRLEVASPLLQPYILKRETSFIIDDTLVKKEEEGTKTGKQDAKKKSDDDDTAKGKKKKSAGDVKDKEGKKSTGDKDKKEKKKSSEKGSEKKASHKNDEDKQPSKSNEKKSSKKSKGDKSSNGATDEPEKPKSKEEQEAEMYELELKSDETSTEESLKSERKGWNKIIEFSEPAIEVASCDLMPLRDIFRTDLVIRIVHLKTLPPVSKGRNKPKKQKKSVELEENQAGEEDVNKEILVSKSTLAKIKIPLEDIIWNKQYLEYAWNINNPYKVEPASDLKTLQYVAKKKKEPKGKKGEAKPGAAPELAVPAELTCHIGVGVGREEPESAKADDDVPS